MPDREGVACHGLGGLERTKVFQNDSFGIRGHRGGFYQLDASIKDGYVRLPKGRPSFASPGVEENY